MGDGDVGRRRQTWCSAGTWTSSHYGYLGGTEREKGAPPRVHLTSPPVALKLLPVSDRSPLRDSHDSGWSLNFEFLSKLFIILSFSTW